jgi:hypothetical protein
LLSSWFSLVTFDSVAGTKYWLRVYGFSASEGQFSLTISSCSDGRQNGDETGVDCGGNFCAPCVGGVVRPVCPKHAAYCVSGFVENGWTLTLAYAHAAFTNPPLDQLTMPTDPLNGFSHVRLTSLFGSGVIDDVTQARFYCDTDAHTRQVSFLTTASSLTHAVATNNLAVVPAVTWVAGTALLPGHTAFLPTATTNSYNQGLTNFPFWRAGEYHWGISGDGFRWECDDQSGNSYRTLHQVWVHIIEATCSDGIRNQGETGVDCNGPCAAICPSTSRTPTKSRTATQVNSLSSTKTPTKTRTTSRSQSGTVTNSATPTNGVSLSATSTISVTPSISLTASRSISKSKTSTVSRSRSRTPSSP